MNEIANDFYDCIETTDCIVNIYIQHNIICIT